MPAQAPAAKVCSCSVEMLCEHAGILRVHETPDGELGDPYKWCCTFVVKGDYAVIKGLASTPDKAGVAAINRALKRAGFAGRKHEKVIGSMTRWVTKHFSGDTCQEPGG